MKTSERLRARIYRVCMGDQVLSEHKKYAYALAAEKKAEGYVSKGFFGLSPETLVYIERWSAKYGTWERTSS